MPLDLDMIRAAAPGREIVWLDSCESTMSEAARLAAGGCPAGTVVVAEKQTAGQGRYKRVWHSERESGLYVSIVFRLGIPEESVRVLSMALGLATAEAIARATDLRPDLRWPNDVLIGEKKCAGILVQVEPPAFIAGIGINVNHESLPPELAPIATSLRIAGGRPQSRELVLIHLLDTVDSFTRMLAEGGKDPVLAMFTRASSYVTGKRVTVELGGIVVEGVTDGLDSSGFLRLLRPDGSRTTILAGGVRPCC
jgi:BirA family biotin operon repressor/biotin-[acetyl-CoA-carboxylase] ligase